jgi:hypothetical protein
MVVFGYRRWLERRFIMLDNFFRELIGVPHVFVICNTLFIDS